MRRIATQRLLVLGALCAFCLVFATNSFGLQFLDVLQRDSSMHGMSETYTTRVGSNSVLWEDYLNKRPQQLANLLIQL